MWPINPPLSIPTNPSGINMLNNGSIPTGETEEGNGSLVGWPGGAAGGLDGTLHRSLSVVLTVMLAMVVFSLGCTVEVGKLWFHLRRPWGILVGLLCQFGFMPLMAYLLARGFSVQPVQAVAIIIMGSCPGGVISNIITFWVEGDMDLSITMTSCSTVLGMGMMPFCLYMYAHRWEQAGRIRIPYLNIGITLITLVVPVTFGVAVNYKWPKAAKIILKVGSAVGGLLLLVVGAASALLYQGSWQTEPSILIIGSTFPLIGYSAGFIIAVILRQPWQRCRTIAMETGAQNVQICSTMLQLSFPPEQLVLMFTFPLVYGSFQLLNGLLLVAVYQIYKRTHQWSVSDVPIGHDLQSMPGIDSGQGEINVTFEKDQPAQTTIQCNKSTLNKPNSI